MNGVQKCFRERRFVNMVKPEWKCKYNVTVRHVRATTVAVEKQQDYILRLYVCILRYRACNTHAPYCHMWSYNIFSHYLINSMIFEKKNYWTWNIRFDFSTNLSKTTPILWRTERDLIKNVYWSSCKVPVWFVRFHCNLHFLDRVSKKKLKYQISWNSIQWQPSCSVRTHGQTCRS